MPLSSLPLKPLSAAARSLAPTQAQEVAGLAGDADLPLDQLLPPEMLARYGLSPAAPAAAAGAAGVKEEGAAEAAGPAGAAVKEEGDVEMGDAGGWGGLLPFSPSCSPSPLSALFPLLRAFFACSVTAWRAGKQAFAQGEPWAAPATARHEVC